VEDDMEERGSPDYAMSAMDVAEVLPGSRDQPTVAIHDKGVASSQIFICNYTIDDITNAVLRSGQIAVEEQRRKGLPVAQYDFENKRAYLEFPDGRREYVNG